MSDLVSLQAIVYGHVQGVFFRDFVSRRARELGLTGYVRNLPQGMVEVNAEGERKQLEQLIDYLKVGPPAAKVEKVETNWSEYSGSYSGFSIRY
ncbi:acylphosphatase [Dehalococcoidales bacterium]|nr:acylphosphatase [Dehalococcoidales bacterium]MCL0094866.1 acylphosphatase [Dehalococcoidales bacterium]